MERRLEELSALEIGELVNKREITPTEVVKYFYNRISLFNNDINVFTYTKLDEALERAKNIEKRLENGEFVGQFAGVPFALKDFLPSKKGWTNTKGGVKSLTDIDDHDSEFCKAMEKAGGIALGKTNAPAFGFRGTTDNKLYGSTKNPFNLKYNSGGSSGGSAAAVSSGLIPIAEGGDAGGSIRIPAAWCNLFGFKPSVGLIPSVSRPDAWAATHPYCFNGGLTKTVEDAAVLLNLMTVYNPRDPLSVPLPKIDYSEDMKKPINGFKIAFTFDFDIFEVEEEIRDIIFKSAKLLEQAGVTVDLVHFNIKHSRQEIEEVWCRAISVDAAIEFELNKDLYDRCGDELPPQFIEYNKKAASGNIMDYYKFNLVRTDILDAIEEVFENYDIIISPTTCCLPVKNSDDTVGPKQINGKPFNELIGFAQTYITNFTGHPSASIPAGFSKNGLPIGMQIIGKKYHDSDVFKVAYNYEQLNPWSDKYKYNNFK